MKNAGTTNSGEAMEKVLAGLRDADAPDGMERRILAGLEERAAVRSQSGWRQLLPVWLVAPARPVAVGSLVCGAALAGIFVVAFAIPAIRRLGHTPVPSKRNLAPVGSLSAANQDVGKSAGYVSSRSRLRPVETKKTEGNAGSTAAALDGNSVALEETHATSYPAPPMPLTEQERLLLRLVHKDDPVELAMLDPKLRALQDSEDKAEFQRFFGQATKQATPEQSMTEQAAPQQSTTEQATPAQSATEQATPAPPGMETSAPEQPVPEQPVPEQPTQPQATQPQATPETVAPDQSTTQQATPKPTRTGDKE